MLNSSHIRIRAARVTEPLGVCGCLSGMIAAFFISILKGLLVLVMLVAMVMVLMGISHLSRVDDDSAEEDAEKLRRQIDEDERVVGDYSVFHRFLARDRRKRAKD